MERRWMHWINKQVFDIEDLSDDNVMYYPGPETFFVSEVYYIFWLIDLLFQVSVFCKSQCCSYSGIQPNVTFLSFKDQLILLPKA